MQSVGKSIRVMIFCALVALPVSAQSKMVEDVEIRGYKKSFA